MTRRVKRIYRGVAFLGGRRFVTVRWLHSGAEA